MRGTWPAALVGIVAIVAGLLVASGARGQTPEPSQTPLVPTSAVTQTPEPSSTPVPAPPPTETPVPPTATPEPVLAPAQQPRNDFLENAEIVAAVPGAVPQPVPQALPQAAPQGFAQVPQEDSRVIALTTEPGTIDAMQDLGCDVRHFLETTTSLACPADTGQALVQGGLAIEDEIYQLHDLAADEYVGADVVWPSYMGAGVRIAILDTGIQTDHVELANSVLMTANFTTQGNNDTEAHGTHVAGIVTGDGIHSLSSTVHPSPNRADGVAPQGGILSAKVCEDGIGCFHSDIAEGIDWAVANGADVINISIGGGNYGTHCDGEPLAVEVNDAVAAGAVVVISAGNDNDGVSSPACASGAIAVGAVYHSSIGSQTFNGAGCTDETTSPGQRVCFSDFGPALDIMAPGAGVLSSYSCHAPLPTGGTCATPWYAWFYGTSMSAPHVSGAAALILDKNPNLSPAEVKSILESSATDAGSTGRDNLFGWGILDVENAIANTPGTAEIALLTNGAVAFGPQTVSVTVDTLSSGINDVERIGVLSGPADLYIRTSLFADEDGSTWDLATAIGTDQAVWEFSTDGGATWTPFTEADSLFELESNVSQASIVDIHFRLTLPDVSTSLDEHSATVTIVAVAP